MRLIPKGKIEVHIKTRSANGSFSMKLISDRLIGSIQAEQGKTYSISSVRKKIGRHGTSN